MSTSELVKSNVQVSRISGFDTKITISAEINLSVSVSANRENENLVWVKINCDPNDPNIGNEFGFLAPATCDIATIKDIIGKGIAKSIIELINSDGSGCVASNVTGVVQAELGYYSWDR